ncbi:MAG: signal peptidase II [Prevotellaceae bacterium]|jgi:signal peptidase II|nr:signal peptidase II [Prevotellaceae bacterium]
MTLGKKAILLAALMIVADQLLKIWIKTHMSLWQEIVFLGNRDGGHVGLYFTENNGFAFGVELFGEVGKLMLTLFRIVFIGALLWFTVKEYKAGASKGVVIGLALMCAGAAGNLIDCLFYGLIFDASTPTLVAQMFPQGGGYAPLGFGKVVDMLYLPIINVAREGGDRFIFFRPIFNVADTAITCSVFYMIFFQRHALSESLKK